MLHIKIPRTLPGITSQVERQHTPQSIQTWESTALVQPAPEQIRTPIAEALSSKCMTQVASFSGCVCVCVWLFVLFPRYISQAALTDTPSNEQSEASFSLRSILHSALSPHFLRLVLSSVLGQLVCFQAGLALGKAVKLADVSVNSFRGPALPS